MYMYIVASSPVSPIFVLKRLGGLEATIQCVQVLQRLLVHVVGSTYNEGAPPFSIFLHVHVPVLFVNHNELTT